GIDTQAFGDHVHLLLVSPCDLRNTESAEGAGWRLVRVDTVRVDPHVGNAVRAAARVAAVFRGARADVGVRARVEVQLALAGDEGAVPLNARLDTGHDGVAGAGEEDFL